MGCSGGLFGGVLGWFTRWKSSQQEKTASVQGIPGIGPFFHVVVKRRGICDRYMLFCESFETVGVTMMSDKVEIKKGSK